MLTPFRLIPQDSEMNALSTPAFVSLMYDGRLISPLTTMFPVVVAPRAVTVASVSASAVRKLGVQFFQYPSESLRRSCPVDGDEI